MAQKVKNTSADDEDEHEDGYFRTNDKVSARVFLFNTIILYCSINPYIVPFYEQEDKNSILDKLRLTGEHLVFKWTSIDLDIKCSDIVASVNIEKVNPELITTIQDLLTSTIPMYNVQVSFGITDDAGCNWIAYNSISKLTIAEVLAPSLIANYPGINVNLKVVCWNPGKGEHIIFLPAMPHLTNNIVTASYYSGSKYQKRNIIFCNRPLNLWRI